MIKDKLLECAAPLTFMAAALATTATAGDNHLIMAGGIGLTFAAAAAFASATIKDIGQKVGGLIPAFSLAANVPLAMNGALLMGQGLIQHNTASTMAGGLLALANGVFYGCSNVKGIMTGIKPEEHAFLSFMAGAAITSAGMVLRDPILPLIGAGFSAEAAMRFVSATKPEPVIA